MPVDDEVIGLVRAHRWCPDVMAQARRLKEAGCTKIFKLAEQDRRDMERICGRRRVLLVYAFLLADPGRTRSAWADFEGSLDRIEAKGGSVVDVDSGLDSKTNPAAFRAVVRDQIARNNQGERSHARKGKPGRQLVVFTAGQHRQARMIWRDVANYPTYEKAGAALAGIVSGAVAFSVTRAFRKWGKRPARKE